MARRVRRTTHPSPAPPAPVGSSPGEHRGPPDATADPPDTPEAVAYCQPLNDLVEGFEYPSEDEDVDERVDPDADEQHNVTFEDPGAHPEAYPSGSELTGTAAERRKAYQKSWQQFEPEAVNIPRPPPRDRSSATRGEASRLKPEAPALDYFEVYWPRKFRDECLKERSWVYAAARGAKSTDFYHRYTPMGLHIMDRCFSVLIRNGLNPVPDISTDLLCKEHTYVFGDDRVTALFDNLVLDWRCFRAFLHPGGINTEISLGTHPITKKLGDLMDYTRLACERNWFFGPNGSIDEMTMGFQGRCWFKQRITYKVEGDGFQVDALCDHGGYTYSWLFRAMDAPKILPSNVKGVSPLHQRMFWLFSRLSAHSNPTCDCRKSKFKHTIKQGCNYDDEHSNTRIYMDNLYLSVRIAELARDPDMPWDPVLVAGPARTNRGVPDKVIQKKIKDKKKEAEAKGTIKVAVRGDILCCSIYDNSPVHMVSTIDSTIEFVKVKEYRVGGEVTPVFKLKLIDLYNKYMNAVDLANQLRNEYRPDAKWWRNNKWWWSPFLWLLGIVCINSYLLMVKRCEEEGVAANEIRTHKQFLEELCGQLAASKPQEKDTRNSKRKQPASAGAMPGPRKRRPQITEAYLARTKEQRQNAPHPIMPVTKKQLQNCAKCAWCRFVSDTRSSMPKMPGQKGLNNAKNATFQCQTCDSILFCGAQHFNDFHKY